MRYVKQFGIILLISFLGEVLHALLPLPVPASIYGIILLFLCLQTGLFKVSAIRETSRFLIEIMPMLFLPAAVGLIESWGVLQPVWVPYLVITVVSTFVVMVCAGRVTQGVIRRDRKGKEEACD
ncbi:MAG: CidA/LrgA family protein [Evtepia sp.]